MKFVVHRWLTLTIKPRKRSLFAALFSFSWSMMLLWHWLLLVAISRFNIRYVVPTDHDIPFSRTFEVNFQVFKDFSLLFQTSIHKKNDQQCTFQIRHTETIWSWVCQKNGGGDWGYVFLTILDDLLYNGYIIIQPQTILLERGVWGSSPRKLLLELVQNPAILDHFGGYTSLVIMTQ